MKTIITGGAIATLLLTSGCATRAGSVAPVAVAAGDYDAMSCAKLREQLVTERAKETALTKKQNNAAVADAAGVFLLLIPVGSIVGADVSGELAQSKGEVMAIERAISTRCDEST